MKLIDVLNEHKGKGAIIRFNPQDRIDLDGYLSKFQHQPEYDYEVRTVFKNNQVGIFWRKDGIIPDAVISLQ